MNINLYDYDSYKSSCPSPYENSYLWKGKLCSIEWNSYFLYADNLNEIEDVLNKFMAYFEIRYNKPSSKAIKATDWFVYNSNDNTFLFFDVPVAIWETNKRKICIGLKWDTWPKTSYERNTGQSYKYHITVRFSNQEMISEIAHYRDSLNNEKNFLEKENQKRDSIRSINSL